MAKRSIFLMAAAALLTTALPATRTVAAEGTPCTFEFDIVVSPGLTTSPSSGTLTSNGETGTIQCNGPVNGRQPTGPGTIGVDGRYGTTKPYGCHDQAQGDGTLKISIPTAQGTEHVAATGTFTHGEYTDGLFAGAFQSDRMSATFQASPTEGDCVSKPMTKFHIRGKGTLR